MNNVQASPGISKHNDSQINSIRSSFFQHAKQSNCLMTINHIMKKLLLVSLVLLSGCAATSSPDSLKSDPSVKKHDTARLRLFGQNGVGVRYYTNSACVGGDKITVSGGLGDAFSSFVGAAKNQSIGMPDTPNTNSQSARNGILSKAFFREYEVTAGQPLTITMGFISAPPVPGTSVRYCKTVATTFTPEPGKDYEGSFDIRSDLGLCVQTINEIEASPSGAKLIPVEVKPAKSCN